MFLREKNDVIVWDPGLFDPTQCAHLPGNDLKIDCLSSSNACTPHTSIWHVDAMCLPTATVCSIQTPNRLRCPTVRRLPSLFVVALASSALCPRRVDNDSYQSRLPDSDRRKNEFVFCETRTIESNMNAKKLSGEDQVVKVTLTMDTRRCQAKSVL